MAYTPPKFYFRFSCSVGFPYHLSTKVSEERRPFVVVFLFVLLTLYWILRTQKSSQHLVGIQLIRAEQISLLLLHFSVQATNIIYPFPPQQQSDLCMTEAQTMIKKKHTSGKGCKLSLTELKIYGSFPSV